MEGEFAPLAPAKRLERAKQRWEKADAVLNVVYSRVKAEVGKGGEAKLRDMQRNLIARRDLHAENDAFLSASETALTKLAALAKGEEAA